MTMKMEKKRVDAERCSHSSTSTDWSLLLLPGARDRRTSNSQP